MRPSDGLPPKKVAFIQCVGSREAARGQPYCSAVCCMHATKQAMIAGEHQQGLETAVFYMDIRSFGKDFEKYYERAKDLGVRYVRCMASTVKEIQQSKDLRLKYRTEEGGFLTEDFSLVVLSLGLQPSRGALELGAAAGVKLDEHGFCHTPYFAPGTTSRPGVFACGAFCGPKDIPETVVEASAAAAHCSQLLAQSRGTETRVLEYPQEKDVAE